MAGSTWVREGRRVELTTPLPDKTPSEYILEFSQSCPIWQQDVIRRLYTQAEFTEQDHQDALKMLKAEVGLAIEGESIQPRPLALEHLVTKKADSPDVVLHQLSDILNVNQLLGDQTLRFAPKGMTVVFGENGSGKSGYCRVLKQVCRIIKDAQEEILGNVYNEQAAPSSAKVKFAVGTETKELDWSEGIGPVEDLARISIFDSLAATFYADKENKVEFVPFQLDIFERLGKVCAHLEKMLHLEIADCQKIMDMFLPEIPDGTKVKEVLTLPASATMLNQLEKLGKWTAADDDGIVQVSKKLDANPVLRLARLQQYKSMLIKLGSEIKSLWTSLDDDAIKNLNSKKLAAKVAKEAADLAARDFGEAEIHLPGTGGDAWRQLFVYAKRYSEVAYPEQPAPVIDNEARCVLCQQELDEPSQIRFASFEKFIQSTAAQEARNKENELLQAQQAFFQINPRVTSEVKQLLIGLEGENPDVVQTLTDCFHIAHARLSEIKPRLDADEIPVEELLIELSSNPLITVMDAIKGMDAEISLLEKALEDQSILDRLAADLEELKARKLLSDSLGDFLHCISAKILKQTLENCLSGCKTTDISKKGGIARKLYISKEFEAQLTREIGTLDLAHIPFKVAERNERGHHLLGVKLNANQACKTVKVLSQGEHRALALACFLTEVATLPGHDGIIVDDPVSSLDHRRRRLVAQRLADEAKKRQVIIFTHDLVFLRELELAATEKLVPTILHSIRKTNEGFGHVMEGAKPWPAMAIKARYVHLTSSIAEIRQIIDQDSYEYKRTVMQYYKDLRDTWERLVEEVLLYEVVQRFDLGVQTMRLKAVEVQDEDYQTIYRNMKKASELCHDEACAVQRPFPNPNELEADLTTIREFGKAIEKRQRDTASKRRAMTESPPTAELV